MLEQLKNAGADNLGAEQLAGLVAFGRMFSGVCSEFGVPVEWLEPKIAGLERELKLRMADENARLLAKAEAQLAALATTEEKRDALRLQIASLKAKQA
jgi:hypothetical protein